MRYATFTTVALCLAAATAFGQQPSGRQSAARQREVHRESDSTSIAREWAAWNAIKDADSAAVVHAIGSSPSLLFAHSQGVSRLSAARFAGEVTKCDTRSHRLDLFNVVHPTDDTAVLIYRVTLDRRCGASVDRGLQQMVMTVWVRHNGGWKAVAQSLTPMTTDNNLK
jgi:ketosteroid isomerase-like protein